MAAPELPPQEDRQNPNFQPDGEGSSRQAQHEGVDPQPPLDWPEGSILQADDLWLLNQPGPMADPEPQSSAEHGQTLPAQELSLPPDSELLNSPLTSELPFPDASPTPLSRSTPHSTHPTLEELFPPFDLLPPQKPHRGERKEDKDDSFLTNWQRKQTKEFYHESVAKAYEAERQNIVLDVHEAKRQKIPMGVGEFVQTLSDADCLKIVLHAIQVPSEHQPYDVRLRTELDLAEPKNWMDILRVMTVRILQEEVNSHLRSFRKNLRIKS